MDDNIKYWFAGFEIAVDNMTADEREKMFRACGCNCVEHGVLPTYKNVFEDAGGDTDLFFHRLNDFDGVITETVVSHKEFNLCFENCVCPLHRNGYISTPKLCECSRQSIMHVMQTLLPDSTIEVKIISTILRGATLCKMNISIGHSQIKEQMEK